MCFNYSNWKRKYEAIEASQVDVSVRLVDLEPDTQYAVYVQTDTVVDAEVSAISNINYNKTHPYSEY